MKPTRDLPENLPFEAMQVNGAGIQNLILLQTVTHKDSRNYSLDNHLVLTKYCRRPLVGYKRYRGGAVHVEHTKMEMDGTTIA
ncbi:MAG: hypothetical protein CSA29_06170 [Desulfobacterales bacterium]|nr:MAG: hypothetical protein CSA29_06170 [Desulfobacterales bacterium]